MTLPYVLGHAEEGEFNVPINAYQVSSCHTKLLIKLISHLHVAIQHFT